MNTFTRGTLQSCKLPVLLLMVVFAAATGGAAVHYVDLNSPNPTAPFIGWSTAANTIQAAVDAALPGDEIVVTNGIYARGGRGRVVATNITVLVNRVLLEKPVTVRSVNGPAWTTIQGYQVPGTTNGPGAIRCVYLASGAVLSGFTLISGATLDTALDEDRTAGGVWCDSVTAVVTNCTLIRNSAAYRAGGAYGGLLIDCAVSDNKVPRGAGGGTCNSTLYHCSLSGNSAYDGGGMFDSTLYDCTLIGNRAYDGGGAYGGTLNNCSLLNNSATQSGGGASGGGVYETILTNCTFTGNTAWFGGGAWYSKLHNCTLTANSAYAGGGAQGGTLNNCVITGNSAHEGGGASVCTLNNCTVTGNSADDIGGAYGGTHNNCIVYYNTPSNYGGEYTTTILNYCCTTPLPQSGLLNIDYPPQFLSQAGGDLRLQSTSPCVNAGHNAYAAGSTDLDGNPRIAGGTVDIGAYECYAPSSITLHPRNQTAEVGSDVGFWAQSHGSVPLTYWYVKDSASLTSTTDRLLVLTNVQSTHAGFYTVVVSNVIGSLTSAPVTLSVIPAVETRAVPALSLKAQIPASVNVEYSATLDPPAWRPLSTVALASSPELYFDTLSPLSKQRFYRASTTGVTPDLDLHMAPAITLTGTIGSPVRLDYINQFGPTNAWVPLATVTLTNTSQLYFDTSGIGQPPRLYRLSNP